jgi:AraC-like DNA-binding protein
MKLLPDVWIDRLKLFAFKYKDGFFEIPYIGDSPERMLDSMKSMPFSKYDETQKKITASSPFIDAEVYAEWLSDGLVIVYTDAHYKKNIIYKQVFQSGVSSEYYSLNYFVNEAEPANSKTIIDDIHFDGKFWTLLKPKSKVKNYHFKNSRSISINVFFTEEWFLNFSKQYFKNASNSSAFVKSDLALITSRSIPIDNADAFLEEIDYAMRHLSGVNKLNALHSSVSSMLKQFDTDCMQDINTQTGFSISNNDRIKLHQVELLLKESMMGKFPGIEYLAAAVSLSETKLKFIFKQIYGATLMEYFTTLKMNAARETLINQNLSIKDLASLHGYENASKFAASFKKQFGKSPTEIQKN